MGKLKIGFVLDDTLDTPDGVQQYVLTLGRWMASMGHEIHYLVGQTTRTDVPHMHALGRNVKVRFNGNGMSTPLPTSRKAIRRLLADEQFDVLHVQIPYSPFMAARIIAAAGPRTAVFGTFHIAPHSGLVRLGNRLLGIWLRKSLRRFDAIFSVSKAAASFAEETFGIKDSTIVPNVVVVDAFAKATPMDVSSSIKAIMYLGRLEPRKGCVVLLEALTILRQKSGIPPWRVVICGRGPLDAELKQYVRDHGLMDMVKFTGFVSDEDKARYLRGSDIAVFPSIGGESFGIVLLEAMAADRPVVLGADNPGYHTVLEPRSDQLFPVRNASALAEKLSLYLEDEHAVQSARTWQQSYIHGFDVAIVGRRLVARYLEALRSRQSMR